MGSSCFKIGLRRFSSNFTARTTPITGWSVNSLTLKKNAAQQVRKILLGSKLTIKWLQRPSNKILDDIEHLIISKRDNREKQAVNNDCHYFINTLVYTATKFKRLSVFFLQCSLSSAKAVKMRLWNSLQRIMFSGRRLLLLMDSLKLGMKKSICTIQT